MSLRVWSLFWSWLVRKPLFWFDRLGVDSLRLGWLGVDPLRLGWLEVDSWVRDWVTKSVVGHQNNEKHCCPGLCFENPNRKPKTQSVKVYRTSIFAFCLRLPLLCVATLCSLLLWRYSASLLWSHHGFISDCDSSSLLSLHCDVVLFLILVVQVFSSRGEFC